MESVEPDDEYEMITRIAQLRTRAQRRSVVWLAFAAGVAAVVVIVALTVGRASVAEPAGIMGAVLAISSLRLAVAERFSVESRFGPVGGLPRQLRRRAVRGLRHGELDNDPLLHEVQLTEVGRLYDRRKDAWIFPILAVVSVVVALGQPVPMRVVLVAGAVLFVVVSFQIFAGLRGAKRILAAD